MGLFSWLIKFTLITHLALFFAFFVVLRLLVDALRYGPRAVLSTKARYQPPDCLQDPELGSHGYIYLKEVRLHYVSAGHESKPLMLLVHGFPEFWYSWRYQLKAFRNTYRVVAIDQRGYGDSDKPPSIASYDVDKLVDDLKQLILALGYKKCVLVGHDWGGKVAWGLAQTHPDMVDRLVVLNCPSTAAYLRHARSGLSQLRKSWYVFFFQLPWLPELFMQSRDFAFLVNCFTGKPFGVQSGKMTSKDVEAYKYNFGRNGFTAPVNYYRQVIRSKYFLTPRGWEAKMVSCPTLIIWGDQDHALETRLAALSSKLSVIGGATVRIIDGASHWVQMDRPELVNKYIKDFLSGN